MKKILIAEIGNNHFGDLEAAKQLIIAANDSGADLVKLQAIDENCQGSMPKQFYRDVSFKTDQYKELFYFAKDIEIDLFFSVISEKHKELYKLQAYHKVTGSMSKRVADEVYQGDKSVKDSMRAQLKSEIPFESTNTFISLPKGCLTLCHSFKSWKPLYVSEYMDTNPQLDPLKYFMQQLGDDRIYGYSDHSIGLEAIERAINHYGARVIEKHFCMKKNESWAGIVFRDTIHGTTPKGLGKIANWLKG